MNKNKAYKDVEKYINSINICSMYNTTEKERIEKREELFKEQREKYGFDERETWNLDLTSILWIYAHLKRYKEWSNVVIYGEKAHYFDVYVIKKENNKYLLDKQKDKFIYDERNLSQGEIIDIILEYFEYYLDNQDDYKSFNIASEGIKLYAEILSSLWW